MAATPIDQRIAGLPDWRGELLARLRPLIRAADPSKLFNSSLDGKVRRAIDFPQGAVVNTGALIALVQAAAAFNKASSSGKPKRAA